MGAATLSNSTDTASSTAPASTPTTITSIDPMTLEPIGTVAVRDRAWVEAAAKRARQAQPGWWKLGFARRNTILARARDILIEEGEEIAELVARECGKTVNGAFASDVLPSADTLAYFIDNTKKFMAREKLAIRHWGLMGRKSYLITEPIGVLGVISPWNFPLFLSMGSVSMALASGNAVILKPSEVTPLVGEFVGELFARAGLPDGVLTVASGAAATGQAVVENVDKVFFIGSDKTGRKILATAAPKLTPCVMELGGNAPALVLRDAYLKGAARGIAWGAFFNSGQICASVQRIYVDKTVFEEFKEVFVAETKKLRQTDDRRQTDIGSLTCDMQMRVVEDLVEAAKAEGASVLTGGKRREDLGGLFFEPTIFCGVEQHHRFAQEEIFGPVCMVAPFDDEQQAVTLANDTRFGLTASVWTRDNARGAHIAEQIQAGSVSVNDHATVAGMAEVPWGGIKDSGFGVIHSRYGLHEFTHRRHIHVNRFAKMAMPWWYPETSEQLAGLKAFGRAVAGSGAANRLCAAASAAMKLKSRLR